jgi:hypothetical protein
MRYYSLLLHDYSLLLQLLQLLQLSHYYQRLMWVVGAAVPRDAHARAPPGRQGGRADAGQHTEGIMLAKNPSGLITSFGHWHGLVVPGICTRWRWQSMACRESNSFLLWTHLKPNAIGNRLGPSGFPLPAPRRMLWIAFNLLQFSASGQIDANCSETETKHNTKRRIRTTLCIATDGSVAWMCTHHGLFHNLNEKQPKCQKDDCEIK